MPHLSINEIWSNSQLKETDKAYLAGIIDGEGSITILHRNSHKGNPVPRTMRLQVYNTNKEIIDWLLSKFGGMSYKSNRGKNKPVMEWYVSANNASDILKLALNYLIIKKNQAVLAIEFQEKFKPHHGLDRVPPNEVIERINMDTKLRMMKKL